MDYTNKAIGFAEDLVSLVKNGSKTLIYRLGDKYDFLEVKDRISVKDSSTEKVFGEIEITEKSTTTFKDLPIDRKGHEKYLSKEAQRKTFERYYGKVEDDDKIIILGFRLLDKKGSD